jgi:glutamate racemase
MHSTAAPMNDAPIGVFDSGIGGLSVLRHIRTQLPHENLLYFADSGFAPYGDKTEQQIIERSLAITAFLRDHHIKALAIPCNTATAAAIRLLREQYPSLPIVGVEPGLKPAAALTKSGTVGVLATAGTLASTKFQTLREQVSTATGVRVLPQACVGLADQVEKGELKSASTAIMIRRYVEPLIEQGADTLVLGCTHYPFVQEQIREVAESLSKQPVQLVDTGEAVARQLARLLAQHNLLSPSNEPGAVAAFTTGSETALSTAFAKLLQLSPMVTRVAAQQS